LGVMLFSYAVRSVYIESCSLFVRGGVYRVVREALGSFFAKLAVSALMFDYILTGPISGVSAGKYIVGLGLETLMRFTGMHLPDSTRAMAMDWGSVILACAAVLYFYRLNIRGIHESSDRALQIMIATTVMAGIMLLWCLLTLFTFGPRNGVPTAPDLSKKYEIELVANYQLTEGSWPGLEKEGVPAEVVASLKPLKDQTFAS